MAALGGIPVEANSYQYEDDDQCYIVEVVTVTGSAETTPSWLLGVSSYTYYPSWN